MEAPWNAHPDIPAGSIGWRMGRGEEYVIAFWNWFNRLPPEENMAFKEQHPEPRGWRGFYESWRGG
jgi:hypothetical protein